MTFERASDAFGQYLRAHDDDRDGEDSLLSFLGWDEPREEDFGRDVRIVLVAADFSRELTSSALWLNERGLDIRCVRVRPHSMDGRIVLDVQQIIPLPEATDYTVRFAEKSRQERQAIRTRAPWTGFWFVNTGMESPQLQESHGRHWNNCRTLGYVAAGGGRKWSGALKRLTPGDPVFAYVSKAGYVGYGKVTRAATPVHLFVLPNGKSLNEHLIRFWKNDQGNDEKWEYAVGVDWEVTYSIDEAKWFPGAFANQNAVCKLRHHETLDFLVKEFRADADLGSSAHPERHASGSHASDE